LLDELSRVEKVSYGIQKDTWGYKKSSIYKITGRHMLNVWRLMRNEVTLISYTIENVVYNLLHHRYVYLDMNNKNCIINILLYM
jgi:DNA polymerase zeta